MIMEWNLPDFVKEKSFLQSSQVPRRCICCLAVDVKFIYLKTCVHSILLRILFGNMLKDDEMVCLSCHKVLFNFYLFKLQAEESLRILSELAPNNSSLKKLNNLKRSETDIYNTPNIHDKDNFDLPLNEPFQNENITWKMENQNLNNTEDNLSEDIDIRNSIEEENVNVKGELSDSESDTKLLLKIKSEVKKRHKKLNKRSERRIKKYSSKTNKKVKLDREEIKIEDKEEATTSFVLSMRGEPLRYSCDHCGRMFQWKCHLKRHIAGAHVSSKLQCSLCAKVFKNDLSLRRHVKYIHERKEDLLDSGPVQCPICLKMFKMKKTLRVHLKRMHRPDTGKEEERYCVECNKLFKSKLYYELHVKTSLKHATDKCHECHDCGKRFSLKGNLVEHIKRLHLKSRNHACSLCGKLFYKEYLRRLHEQHSHMGVPKERNHTCSMCGKAFTCSQVLKRHMIIHSGVKPYQCSYCPSKFTQKSTLKTHCKFKHKEIYQTA